MKRAKKEKKEKVKQPELVLGEKIKDVKINQKQHFLLFVSMIIFFNLLLICAVGFVLVYIDRWYNWVLCFVLIGLSFGLSFRTYRNIKTFHACTLYDNALVINSIWFEIVVDLKNIYELQVNRSVLDRIFRLETHSLEVKMLNSRRKKFTIHFIEENAVRLKQKIIQQIDKISNDKVTEKSK